MNCKWCDSVLVETEAPDIRPSWKRWTCSGCGSIGYHENPSSKELESVYRNAWLDPGNQGSFAAGSTSRDIAESLIKIGLEGSIEKTCLDYGAGKGVLAERLVSSGCKKVYVVEPFGPNVDVSGVEWHKTWDGLPPGIRFDRIFMIEVIEHLLSPVSELRKARSALSETGVVLITTPNARGWRAILEKGKWREAQNPTHLNLFSYRSLKLCLQSAGYTEIHRVNKTMLYNKKGILGFGLRLTQILKLDGSLRVLAR